MDILNINLEEYFGEIIDVYTQIFGNEYREIIEEKIKNADYVTYSTANDVSKYIIFLEDCKARELSIKFLKEIGIDVSKLEGKKLTEEVPNKIRRLITEYIGGYSGFTYKPEQNIIGIRAFDKNVQKENKEYMKEIIKNQVEFIYFLTGEDIYSEEELKKFLNTPRGKEIYKKIQKYIEIYNEIFKEYEEYLKSLEPLKEFVRDKRNSKEIEDVEFYEILSKLGDTEENRELVNSIKKEGRLFVIVKNRERPIMFYTAKEGGMLDYSMLHEFCHVIETQIKNGKCVGSGFDTVEEKNPYRSDKRKYERLNENITDIFSVQGTRILHGKGKYLLEQELLTIDDLMEINTSKITKNMLMPFLKRYKKQIIKARITGCTKDLFDLIGEDNFEELNDCINKVDYLVAEENLSKNLKGKSKTTKRYEEELARLEKIYRDMEVFSSREEETR